MNKYYLLKRKGIEVIKAKSNSQFKEKMSKSEKLRGCFAIILGYEMRKAKERCNHIKSSIDKINSGKWRRS